MGHVYPVHTATVGQVSVILTPLELCDNKINEQQDRFDASQKCSFACCGTFVAFYLFKKTRYSQCTRI
jgi:hypothetical protein